MSEIKPNRVDGMAECWMTCPSFKGSALEGSCAARPAEVWLTAPGAYCTPWYIKEVERLQSKLDRDGGGCTLAGSGRGDCEHAVGLPGKSIPDQHDGSDDTVDAYGKPNGWCWSCWKSHRIQELEAEDRRFRELVDALMDKLSYFGGE